MTTPAPEGENLGAGRPDEGDVSETAWVVAGVVLVLGYILALILLSPMR